MINENLPATGNPEHHRIIYISDKNKEEFIKEFIMPQIKTKNKKNIQSIIDYIKLETVFFEEKNFGKYSMYFEDNQNSNYNNGLYLIRHLSEITENSENKNPKSHKGVFGHCIFFRESSPSWWKNMDIFLNDEKNFLLKRFFKWPLKTNSLTDGNGEYFIEEFYVRKNIALHIEGWDDDDPPMQFLIIGNPSNIPVPRFSSSGTEGLVISFSSNENGEMRNASVLDGGKNYFINDKVLAHYGQISGAIVQVTEVDDGVCTKVKVLSGGQNYPMIGTATTTMYGWDGVFGETYFPKHPNLFL